MVGSLPPADAGLVRGALWTPSSRLPGPPYCPFPGRLAPSPSQEKPWTAGAQRWGPAQGLPPGARARRWEALGLLRPETCSGAAFPERPHALVWNPVGTQFSVPNLGTGPASLPATFREARGPRARRPAERGRTASAMGSVAESRNLPGASPSRLRLQPRSAGRGRPGAGRGRPGAGPGGRPGAGPGGRPARREAVGGESGRRPGGE